MRRNNRRLFRAARGIIGSDWEAEEVMQDAYVKAFRGLEAFRQEAALGTWLTRIVINEAQGRLRGRRDTLPLTELDDNTMGEIIQFRGEHQMPIPSGRRRSRKFVSCWRARSMRFRRHFVKCSSCGTLKV